MNLPLLTKKTGYPFRVLLRYPVLLVHGLGLRDDLPLLRYWGRLPGYLRGLGVRIHLCRHDAWASVENNAVSLKNRIEEILQVEETDKINIMAHSKGGIESRLAAHLFSNRPPIASIVTIATPHRGAALADWVLRFKPVKNERLHQALTLFSRLIGDRSPDSLMALSQLTTEYMAGFNIQYKDHPDIYYCSIASRMYRPVLDPLFIVSHRILAELEGENDGVVGTENCRWGESFSLWGEEKGLSHIDVCDMSGFKRRGFDILEAYRKLIQALRGQGF